jgi:FtsZ-binding cell division protein ZapB
MLENTLPQLEQLIEDIIAKNNQLKNQVAELEQQKSLLLDENETLQLEALDGEEKQKQTNNVLTGLLGKLQSVEEVN